MSFREKTVLTLFDIPRQIATAFKTHSTSHEFLCSTQSTNHPSSHSTSQSTNYVYFKASAYVRPRTVCRILADFDFSKVSDEKGGIVQARKFEINPEMEVVVSTGSLQVDQNYFSVAESVEFLASGRVFSYGYFYNPKNPRTL